jgi:hypothetical protein
MDYGLKAQADYKKHNQKMPVFPMEWIIMLNFENLQLTKFDSKSAKPKVLFYYLLKIKGYVNSIVSQEIDNRNVIESFFIINQINFMIEEIEKTDTIETFDCDFCTYSGFLSQLQCNNCKKKGCLLHSIQCKCLPTDFMLRYRYLTSELVDIKNKKYK